MSNFHSVQKGDNLSKIAKQYGTTVTELRKLNDLRNPNRLDIGQKIALRKEAVCGLESLFLDADRNPIKGLEYILEYCGRSIKGITGEDGKAKKILTDAPTDQVRILVKRFDGTLKEITTVISGYWNKLVTLVSPLLVIDTELMSHPKQVARTSRDERIKPTYGQHNPTTPTTNKKELGPKGKQTITPDGKPVTVIEGDIPGLDEFLETYVGGEVTQGDIEAAAKELGCEPGLIYAIAKQESSSSSFFMLGSRTVPKILYERHWFKKLTRPNKSTPSPYEKTYQDICGPAYRRAKKNKEGKLIDQSTKEVITSVDDTYGPEGLPQYKRLMKAYQLDHDAALQSCSWGKFQIMGFNYKAAGFANVISFTKAMSRGDPEHIKAFLKFAKNNPILLTGLKKKDFEKIAAGHNGKEWRTLNAHYALNLEKFYGEYLKNK